MKVIIKSKDEERKKLANTNKKLTSSEEKLLKKHD